VPTSAIHAKLLLQSIPFFGAPFVTPYVSKYRHYQRQMVWSGFAICVLSLILASFATNIWALIAFQGAGFGFGVLVLYYAVLAMLDSWFVRRRGEAYGYLFGAAGAAGIGLPFMFQALLDRFDYATTLRFYALFVVCLVGTPMAMCRGRYTYTTPDLKASANIDKSILKNRVFYMFWAANMLQGIAFVLPGFYLTSRCVFALSPQ
jgi:MFS family permease